MSRLLFLYKKVVIARLQKVVKKTDIEKMEKKKEKQKEEREEIIQKMNKLLYLVYKEIIH